MFFSEFERAFNLEALSICYLKHAWFSCLPLQLSRFTINSFMGKLYFLQQAKTKDISLVSNSAYRFF